MTLDATMRMRSTAVARTDSAAAMMDVGDKADNTRMARRQTVIRERDAAAMGARIRHVEEITSVTHQDHHHHLLRLATAEVEAEEAADFLKVSGRERTITKLVLANPCLRKIPRHNISTLPWLHLSPRSSTTKITTLVLSALAQKSAQLSTQ